MSKVSLRNSLSNSSSFYWETGYFDGFGIPGKSQTVMTHVNGELSAVHHNDSVLRSDLCRTNARQGRFCLWYYLHVKLLSETINLIMALCNHLAH